VRPGFDFLRTTAIRDPDGTDEHEFLTAPPGESMP
jgi:hypothetical protein